MKNSLTRVALGLTMSVCTVGFSLGCDDTVKKTEQTKTNSDGSTMQKTEETKVNNNGTVTKETSEKKTAPINP